MDLSWIGLVYGIIPLSETRIPFGRAFGILGGMLILSFALARGMDVFGLTLNRRRWIFLGYLVACSLIGLATLRVRGDGRTFLALLDHQPRSLGEIIETLPIEFIVILVVILVLWRGIDLANVNIEPAVVLSSFRLGVTMFLVYGVATPRLDDVSTLALYLFIYCGLLAMSAARVYALSRLRGSKSVPFDRRWGISIGLAVLGIVGLSALTIGFLRQNALMLLGGAFQLLRQALVLVFVVVLLPPLTLLLQLLLLLGEKARVPRALETLSEALKSLLEFFEGLFGPEVQALTLQTPYLKALLLGGLALLLALFALAALQINVWRHRRKGQEDLEKIPVDLSDSLRSQARRAAGLGEHLGNLLRLRRPDRLLAAARIRRIYARLIALSADLGHPRPPARTPQEFLRTLEGVFPTLSNELCTITEAYQRVRYGELPETLKEVHVVDDAWGRVSAVGKARLEARKRG
jgi:hypothetical protein